MQLCQRGHSIFKPTCRECLKLKREWYTHLNQTGFEDIEKGQFLKESDLGYRRQIKDPDLFKAKQNYFIWAQSQIYDSNFQSTKDKLLWESHADGLSQREIAPRFGIGQPWVARKLRQIETYLKFGMMTGSLSASASASSF